MRNNNIKRNAKIEEAICGIIGGIILAGCFIWMYFGVCIGTQIAR